MSRARLVIALVGATLAAGAEASPSTYAGISYSPSAGTFAVGKSSETFLDAFHAANTACGATDCFVEIGVQAGWLAVYYASVNGPFGFGGDLDRDQAIRTAQKSCAASNGGSPCVLSAIDCSWDDCSQENPSPLAVPAVTRDEYVVMAFSPTRRAVGSCNGQPTFDAGLSCALADCGGGDCTYAAGSQFCASYVTRGAVVDANGVEHPAMDCFSNGYDAAGSGGYASAICEQFGGEGRLVRTDCTANVVARP